MGPFEISVGSLTNAGIKFQKSANIGAGRSANQNDVDDAIAGKDRLVVVDIGSFPHLTFIPLDTRLLLRQAHIALFPSPTPAPEEFGLQVATSSERAGMVPSNRQQPRGRGSSPNGW